MDGLIPATADGTTSSSAGVVLDLAPSVSPYLQHASLSIKVERLPPRARLSKGRNNGDHSWSLSPNELEDLMYLPPEGLDSAHSLTVRIISLDSDSASTLVQFDVPITPVDANPAATAEVIDTPSTDAVQDADVPAMDARIAELSEELSRLRNDAAAAETTHAAETADLITRHHLALKQQATEIEARHAQELEQRLTDEKAVWEIEQQARLTSAIDETAQQSGEEVRAEIERTNEVRLSHELGRQLADARTQWEADQREVIAAAVQQAEQNVRSEIEQTNEARLSHELGRQMADARVAWETEQQDVIAATVKQAEATIQARLEQTNEARLSLELAQRLDQHLADAKVTWEEERQSIMAAAIQDAVQQAETQARTDMEAARLSWREAAVHEVAELTARCTGAENALADAQREIQLLGSSPEDEAALAALRNELTSANTAIHTLESELSETRHALEQASIEMTTRPMTAEDATKDSDEPSYREAELEFRLNEVIAEADAALTEHRAAWDREREELQDRLEETAQQRVDEAFAQWQQETQAVLAKAKQDWGDNEAVRLAVAEAQWREKIGITKSRGAVAPITQRRRRLRITGRALRYGVIAACLVGAVMFYPRIESHLPDKWWPNIATYRNDIEPVIRETGNDIRTWVSDVLNGPDGGAIVKVPVANVRDRPSTSAAVVTTLSRNSRVTPLDRQGNWIQVRTGGPNGKTGWLHVTLLKGGVVQ